MIATRPLRLPRCPSAFRVIGRLLWQPLPGAAAREHGEMLSLAVFVCLALFGVKAFIACRDLDSPALPPQVVSEDLWLSAVQIALCTAEDFAVGAACLLAVGLGLRLTRPVNGRRALRLASHVLAALALAYMLVNAQVFHVIHCFLTYALFQMGGGFQPERSIQEYATTEVRVAVGLLPLLVLGLHLAVAHGFPRFWEGAAGLVCRPLVLLGAALVLAGAAAEVRAQDQFRKHRSDFAQNPHLLMARSLLPDPDTDEGVDATPADPADFQPGRPRHARPELAHRPKNIVVIVLESGGARYMQTYGYPLETTPNLCRLAGRSVRVEHFYSTSNKTIAAALPLCGSTWNDPRTLATAVEYPNCPVPAASTWLGGLGYRTAFLGAGGASAWEGPYNLHNVYCARGWDVARDGRHPFWAEVGGRDRFASPDYLDAALFADARRYIGTTAGQKFFLLLWNYDTHAPFFAREDEGPEWDPVHFPAAIRGGAKENEFRRFLNSLRRTDALIGEFYAWLEREGLADDTLVVVTGDHGEAFGQHGHFAHGPSLFEEEVRVPLLLIHRPLAEAVGTTLPVIGSHIDVWATITDVCDLPFDPRWQGRSLLGPDGGEPRRAYLYRRDGRGLREGRWKYLWDLDANRAALYDVEADPDERHDLSADHPEYCAQMQRRLRGWTAFQGG